MRPRNSLDSSKRWVHLINQLALVLRSTEVHEVENIAVGRAISGFLSQVNEVVRDEGEFTLELRGDFFFLNALRIRYASEVMINFDYLVRSFRNLEIGSMVIKPGVGAEDMVALIKAIVHAPAVAPFEAIQQRMSGISNIQVHRLKKIFEKDILDARQMVKRTYFRAVSFTQGLMHRVQRGEKISLKKTKRMIVSLVDQILGQEQLLLSMTSIKNYDEYTYHHCVNVSILSVALGQRLGLSKRRLTELGMASLFHDIGKTRIPKDILNKTTPLTKQEWALMQKHSADGVRILMRMRHLDLIFIRAIIVAFEHHMSDPRGGYPKVAQAFTLDLFSRIVSIADKYDAMTSARVYSRTPRPPDRVLNLMIKQTEDRLDLFLLQVFVNIIGVYPAGTLAVLDSGELGLVYESNPGFVDRPRVLIISDSKGNQVESFLFDLAEKDADGKYQKAIARTLDAHQWHINIADYLL